MKNKSNYSKFLLLWSGELISAIGGGLSSFGLGVYVFSLTGSAGSMALVTLLAFLPTLLLSAPAGVLADRYDRRLLMMIGDGLSALGLIYILVCMMTGGAQLYQICIGVFISSVFSSLLEPSYKATVTDLLTKEEYSKASGMVSLAGSARYLISPLLAGLLLEAGNIQLLLIIDICTFFLTVVCTAVVRNGLEMKKAEPSDPFWKSFRDGWQAVTGKQGVLILIIVAIHNLFAAFVQPFSGPLSSGLRAAGDVTFTMWASLFATVVCRTFLSFLLAKWMRMGVIGIALAMVLDWCIKAALDIARFRSKKWAGNRII